jgi:branched-subunit amino acid aminotransferase/4-amino-4-deoxychorismate lyase
MIWVAGRIVRDRKLKVSALDRTFEHGLGLFETLRTWDGRAVLLERHMARLSRSASELGLPLGPAALPDASAVAKLLRADRVRGDVVLRITLTGGLPESGKSTLWMRTAPLPPPRTNGVYITFEEWEVSRGDPIARHKALNYWSRRLAFEHASQSDYDEILSHTGDGLYWEGSRTNLFIVKDGELLTPSRDGPIVPGVMREVVLGRAVDLSMTVRQTNGLSFEAIQGADEVFLTNAVRGIIPVAEATPCGSWPAPGPWTEKLRTRVSDWIDQGGPESWS